MKRVILLADDSPTIQRLVTQTFQGSNYDIVSVSNGDAAIRKFEEIHPALILADIYMPGRNGYEVCAYVKKHPQYGQTPVVLLAGAFDAFDDETAYQVGAATHVTKPFEPHALVNLVESLLSNGREEGKPASALPEPPAPPTAPAPLSPPVPDAPPVPDVIDVPEAPPESSAPAPSGPSVKAEEKPEEVPEPVALAAQAPDGGAAEMSGDLLGLQELFKPPEAENRPAVTVTDEEIDRIADRVIQKLSTQVIESVAWDVVPDITAKVLREELKRQS